MRREGQDEARDQRGDGETGVFERDGAARRVIGRHAHRMEQRAEHGEGEDGEIGRDRLDQRERRADAIQQGGEAIDEREGRRDEGDAAVELLAFAKSRVVGYPRHA